MSVSVFHRTCVQHAGYLRTLMLVRSFPTIIYSFFLKAMASRGKSLLPVKPGPYSAGPTLTLWIHLNLGELKVRVRHINST